MTERLYYRDAHALEFDATVIEFAGDARHVVLDRTAFYPTSGGQPHDTGRLDGTVVVDVIDDGARVIHVVDADLPLGPVHGIVDPARRRDHMQQHTAQHLLSALAGDRFQWETASVHFGADHSAIEFAIPSVSAGQLADLEQWANAVVAEARAVTVSFEDAAAAGRAGLRKPSGRTGEIRIITIAELDRSACGGTHVSRTSEIGPVLLLGVETLRGHVRVGFLAGGRVLDHARAGDAALAGIASAMSCAVDELPALVPARQQEIRTLRDRVAKLEQEVASARIAALLARAAPAADGIRRVLHHATDESPAMLRSMAQTAGALDRVMLVALAGSPPTIYFATGADSNVDAGARLKLSLAGAGGRGGGSPRVAQGTAPTLAVLQEIAAALLAT